jgi:hypothetical protein
VGALAFGRELDSVVLAQNLVFVPLLALGCFGVACRAYGRAAGLLAVVFALAAPMTISQFHQSMLDVPTAALAAVAAWLLLCSDRFARTGASALAGLAIGAGLLAKQPFALFVAGLVLVMLVRGGWRNWRGLVVCAAVAAAVAATWYLPHLGDTQQAADAGGIGSALDRIEAKNLWFYGWSGLNLQLLVPLAAFAVTGAAILGRRFLRERRPDDPTPELVGGLLVGWLGVVLFIPVNDPRYTLPCLVYLAALGAGWIPALGASGRRVATAGLVLLLVVNTLTTSFGAGPTLAWEDERVSVQGYTTSRALTLLSDQGWLVAAPQGDDEALGLLRALDRQGVGRVEFDPDTARVQIDPPVSFNGEGMSALAYQVGLERPPAYDPVNLRADDVLFTRRPPAPGLGRPCLRFADGTGLYLHRGPLPPGGALARDRLFCP